MTGPNAAEMSQEIDPEIGNIQIGCPEGHGSAMTVSQALHDPTVPEKIRNQLGEQVASVGTLVEAGIEREQAIGISLGGLALKDERGGIVRSQPEPELSTPQPDGSKKK